MEEKRYNPRLTKSREEFIQLMKSFDLAHATENQMGKIFQFTHDGRTVNSWSILISFFTEHSLPESLEAQSPYSSMHK